MHFFQSKKIERTDYCGSLYRAEILYKASLEPVEMEYKKLMDFFDKNEFLALCRAGMNDECKSDSSELHQKFLELKDNVNLFRDIFFRLSSREHVGNLNIISDEIKKDDPSYNLIHEHIQLLRFGLVNDFYYFKIGLAKQYMQFDPIKVTDLEYKRCAIL